MEAPSPEIIAKLEQLNGWSITRRNSFEKIEEQLDMLYHDINNGFFGEQAKQSTWFQHVSAVKQQNPKPSQEELNTIEQELQQLINQENG